MADKKPATNTALDALLAAAGAGTHPDTGVNVTDQSFYDNDGNPIKVEDSASIADAFRAGKVGIKPGQNVTIRRPDTGELASVAAEDLDRALSQGAQIATNKEHRQALLEKKYGNTPLGGLPGLLGAATQGMHRGFSFGLTDKARVEAARLWGGDEAAKKQGAELKELEEYAPVASGGGELAGIALQTALPMPKFGAAAKGAEAAAAVGEAASRTVAPAEVLGRVAETETPSLAKLLGSAPEVEAEVVSQAPRLLPEAGEATLATRAAESADAYNAARQAEGQAARFEGLLGANKTKKLKGKALERALLVGPEDVARARQGQAYEKVVENIGRTAGGEAPPTASLFESLGTELGGNLPGDARLVDGGVGTSAKFLGGESRIMPEVLRETQFPLARVGENFAGEAANVFAEADAAARAASQRASVAKDAAEAATGIGNLRVASQATQEYLQAIREAERLAAVASEAAAKAGLPPSAIGTLGRSVAEGAAYGAAGQAQHNISESAFGDTDLTAEKLLAGTGEGAVFGALLGGGIGAAGLGLGAMRRAVAPEVSKLGAKAAFDMHGNVSKSIRDQMAKVEGAWGTAGEALGRYNVVATDAAESLGKTRDGLRQVVNGLNEVRGGQATIDGARILSHLESQPFLNIAGKNYSRAEAAAKFPWFAQADAQFMSKEMGPILQQLGLASVDEFTGAVKYLPHNTVNLADLLEQRMGLDKLINYGAKDPAAASQTDLRKAFRQSLEKVIEKEIEKTGGKTQLGKLQQLKKDYQILSLYEEHLSSSLSKSEATMDNWLPKNSFSLSMMGALGGAAAGGAVGSPLGAIAGLASKAAWNNGGKAVFANSMLKLGDLSAVKGTIGAIDQTFNNTILKALTATQTGKLMSEKSDKQSIDKQYASAARDYDRLKEIAGNPEVLNRNLSNAYGPLRTSMPDTHSAVVGTVTRATQFLQSKEPPKLGNPNPLQPGLNSTAPSDSEKQRFVMYNRTIRDPMSVLRDFRNGSVAPEQVEALKAVYPKLYDDIRQRVLAGANDMAQRGKEIPYRRRLEIASLFGAPDMDPTLNPAYIQQIQGTFGSGQQAPPQGQQPTQQGPAGKPAQPMQGFSKMVTQFNTAERRMR